MPAARGSYSAAATFLSRAAELSPEPVGGWRRRLAAAQAALAAGELTRAASLLDQTADRPADDVESGLSLQLSAAISTAMGKPVEATGQLLDAARSILPVDIGLGREVLLDALEAANCAGRSTVDGLCAVVSRSRVVRRRRICAGASPIGCSSGSSPG